MGARESFKNNPKKYFLSKNFGNFGEIAGK